MSVVTAVARELMALGAAGEALLEALARIEEAVVVDRAQTVEQAVQIATRKEDEKLAARKAKDCERQRVKRASKKSVDVQENPRTSTDIHGNPGTVADDASRSHVEDTSLPSLRSEEIIPLTHPSGASPAKPKLKTGRSRLVPDGWQPPPKVMADLAVRGFTPGEIERELANFRDHEFRDPKSAWDLAFRTWMQNSRNFQPRKAPHERPDPDAKFNARQANHADAFEGARRAAGRDWKP